MLSVAASRPLRTSLRPTLSGSVRTERSGNTVSAFGQLGVPPMAARVPSPATGWTAAKTTHSKQPEGGLMDQRST